VLVLEDEREWNCGRCYGARRLMLGYLYRYPLAFGEKPGCARGLSLDCDELVRHEPGGLSSGNPQLVSEETIEPFTGGREDGEREVLPFSAAPRLFRLHSSSPEPTPLPLGVRPPSTRRPQEPVRHS
jgi:hypothetical protein